MAGMISGLMGGAGQGIMGQVAGGAGAGMAGAGGGNAATKYGTESAIGQSQAAAPNMSGPADPQAMMNQLPADQPVKEKINWADMSDDDVEKDMYKQAFGGEGLDFETMDDDQKKRYIDYLTKAAPKKDPGLSPLGLSQSRGKDMSSPGGLGGLMAMANSGNRTRRVNVGLMGQ